MPKGIQPDIPAVSVLLPVFNGESTVRRSILSILNQEFLPIEVVIVNDGSTDSSSNIILEMRDPRIHFVELPKNTGLSFALNFGLSHCRAALVARQDQDDVSYPSRLRKQVEFLSAHPEIGLLGTWARRIEVDKDRLKKASIRHPTQHEILRWRLMWNNPFVHSTVIFRRGLVEAVGGYPHPTQAFPEDYALWSELASRTRLANLPNVLVDYYRTPSAMSQARRQDVSEGVVRISSRNLGNLNSGSVDADTARALALSLNGKSAGLGPLGAMATCWEFARVSSLLLQLKLFLALGTFLRSELRILLRGFCRGSRRSSGQSETLVW